MTIQINLPPEIAERLREEAKRRGETDESVALKVLDRNLPQRPKDPKELLQLLEQWKKEVELMTDEEFAENEQIHRNIDAERPEGQKLFPDLCKPEPK
jgi:hypothetical protein